MIDDSVHALGPLFGPDFITVVINDETEAQFALEIFPDANNPALKRNGLPTQFYYLPKQIYLAKRVDSPTDFDFSVTLFKGLMTTEDTLGISGIPSVGGAVEAGGAFMTFSTTMAVPESVIAQALAKLKSHNHETPPTRIGQFFGHAAHDPAPLLGIVPIVDNSVTIEVPQLPGAGDDKSPFFISAQGTGHGSIEASGISSFLVTCNQLAAGAIVGALKNGRSPFTVHYNMKLLFYMNACDIHMTVDVDKTFTQFSGAAQAKYGFLQADLAANYQNCLTSGGITTVIQRDGASVDADMKKLIDKTVTDMQEKAWNMVKTEIFDFQPKPDDPAKASAGACGGAAVSLKFNYQKRGVKFNDHFEINQTISKDDTVSGTLNNLEPAIKANLDKYLSIVDIGEFFRKIQIAASPNIDFGDSEFSDPINSAMIQVSYPLFTEPIGPDGKVNLKTLAQGFHYVAGTKTDQTAPVTLASWSRDNPRDIINISFLKLDRVIPEWDNDQVKITKKLVYKPNDARVDLSNGGIIFETERISNDHSPVIGPEEVGYVYVKFFLDRPIKAPNISVTLTIKIGERVDIIEMSNADPLKNPVALWQIWSDKFFNETVAKVKIDVTVTPPPSDFTGDAVTWSGFQAVPLALGRIKRIVPCKLILPKLTDPDKNALVAKYVVAALKEAATP